MVKRTICTTIFNCLLRLQDPYLVSGFQNYFGIYALQTVRNGNSQLYDKTCETIKNGVSTRKYTARYTEKDVADDEKIKGNEVEPMPYKVHSFFWYYIFRFGTSLGYEFFYASFFPFWVWNLNFAICRRVINVWVCVMYIGQMLKDIICWPRPSSPPVVHLEPSYVMEYGMPSTHAMVSFALPFSYWYFSSQRYEYSFCLGITVCSVWCLLVCCSRLYMGMHTVLDIMAGLLLAPVLMGAILPFSDGIDKFQQTSLYSPLVTTITMIFLQWLYPQPNRWSPARGDTSVIMGTGTGFAFGSWLTHHLGFDCIESSFSRIPLSMPSFHLLTLWILRMSVGLSCIVFFRIILKKTTTTFLCFIMKLNMKNLNSYRNSYVEIPSKYITYVGIGLVITFIAPRIFYFLRIHRESMHYEV